MQLSILDKFILKAFPRLVYLSIVIEPLTDKLFMETKLWSVFALVAFGGMCIWEFMRGESLRKKYGSKKLNEYICYNNDEFKYDMLISILGLVVYFTMHDGPLWFILIAVCLSTAMRYREPIMKKILDKFN